MKTMTQNEYIKEYCDGKHERFNLPPVRFEQRAFYDATYYYDAERDIEVEHSIYIGD